MHNNVDEWHFGLTEDEKVGDKALELLDKYGRKPFFFFVHCAEVDHSGHKHGEPSPEYNAAIISGDKQLGRIVEKLKQLGVYDKTLIYVTADHGFDVGGKGHGNAPYVFLGTNDKQVMRGGTRADITPTILDRLGVDLAKLTPPLDGETLAKPATKTAQDEHLVKQRAPRPSPKANPAREAPNARPARRPRPPHRLDSLVSRPCPGRLRQLHSKATSMKHTLLAFTALLLAWPTACRPLLAAAHPTQHHLHHR